MNLPGYPQKFDYALASGYSQSDPNQTCGYPRYPQTGHPQGGEYPPNNYPGEFSPDHPKFIFVQPGNDKNRISGGADNAVATNDDVESGSATESRYVFTDTSIRHAFIRKVYFILMFQLILTFGIIALMVLHKPAKQFVLRHVELLIIALVVYFATVFAIICVKNVRYKVPLNLIVLIILTVSFAIITGYTTVHYEVIEILMAFGITAVVCLALTIFAFQTKWDFTVLGSSLYVALIIFVLFGILSIFFRTEIVSLIYSSIGALLFSVYLIYDTQLMLGGNHAYSISPEDYILAALNLYIDIMYIFIYILRIIGQSRN